MATPHDAALQLLLKHHEKEYRCHVRFVVEMAIALAKEHGASEKIVHIAALLHDIGRGQEQNGEHHRDASVTIATEFLATLELDDAERGTIIGCIGNHDAAVPPRCIEESIIISSDSGSKVLWHEAFMLMCKKETFRERAEWGRSYVVKGFNRTTLPDVKELIRPEYERLLALYDRVLSDAA